MEAINVETVCYASAMKKKAGKMCKTLYYLIFNCHHTGCAAIQRDLCRLEKWAERSLIKFHRRKCKSCTWQGITPAPVRTEGGMVRARTTQSREEKGSGGDLTNTYKYLVV